MDGHRRSSALVRASAVAAAFALAWWGGGCAEEPPTSAAAERPSGARDSRWAVPIEKTGLPNLHKVSEKLYRGAQPTAEGVRELERMGVRTIVNLRSFHSDRDEIGPTEIGYEHIYVKAWHPEDEEVVRFLRIVADPKKRPVFVHCQHGADRTGTMVAMYRIAVEGWTVEEAIREMREGGYGFHRIWRGLAAYLRELDIRRIRKEAGLDG